MKGKSYNRGVRTHKIMNEVMQNLKWNVFQKWPVEKARNIPEDEKESISEDVTTVRVLLQSKRDRNNNDEVKSAVNSFIEKIS